MEDKILRHKTAIRRGDYSRPIKCLLRDGLIDKNASLFDYGCGHGEDIALLSAEGYACSGRDPAFRPDAPLQEADVVNLGFVINVIEDPNERADTIRRAWELTRQILVVAAQVLISSRGKTAVEFGDGYVTCRGTFQKLFDHRELREFLESTLEVEAIPAGLGTFYLFKDEAKRQQFMANRFRRREIAPRQRLSDLQFEQNRELLEALMAAVAALGRLPDADEFERSAEIIDRFGSLKRAFAFLRRRTGDAEWEQIAKRRTEDMLVYLALARFRKRPPFSALPRTIQRDIKVFFRSYANACAQADELLFRAGDPAAVDAACGRSSVGKLLPDDLYVHRSALDYLEPLLRVYEGCGRAYVGEVESANIVKIHRRSGKLSYLVYPDFDSHPHPSLFRCVRLSLRTLELQSYDYAESDNPPVLHRKETFLHPDHPLRAKFARLTAQEERNALLTDAARIGTRRDWESRLHQSGFALRGHQLVRRSSECS